MKSGKNNRNIRSGGHSSSISKQVALSTGVHKFKRKRSVSGSLNKRSSNNRARLSSANKSRRANHGDNSMRDSNASVAATKSAGGRVKDKLHAKKSLTSEIFDSPNIGESHSLPLEKKESGFPRSKEQRRKIHDSAKIGDSPSLPLERREPGFPRSKKQRRKLNSRKRTSQGSSVSRIGSADSVLESARFRYINELLYSQTGADSMQMFSANPDSYTAYHRGFQSQVAKWPINPLDLIIENVNAMPASHVVADLGCGEGRLASSVRQPTVHSFDLVSSASHVTTCDISSHVPLPNASVDVVVLCLALMSSDAAGCLSEVNRLLKVGGKVRIAEVASRLSSVDQFVACLSQVYGFRTHRVDQTYGKYFVLFRLTKSRDMKGVVSASGGRQVAGLSSRQSADNQLPLKPCLYKRR